LKLLKFRGVQTTDDWLTIGVDVPSEFFDEYQRLRHQLKSATTQASLLAD